MQMVMGAVLVYALHAAFEHGEESLDGVGMQAAVILAHILAALVVDDSMPAFKHAPNPDVAIVLVSHEPRFPVHVLPDDRDEGRGFHVVHDEAADLLSVPVHQRKNLVLVVEAAPLLHSIGLDALIAADIGLIYFHDSAASAERLQIALPHRFPDPVRHEP